MNYLSIWAAMALLASPALAADLASSDAITAAISGNTVQGSMVEAGGYTEFYDTDGSIKADGYGGKWTVEYDQMCFDYGEGKGCWGVQIDGDTVAWIKDGKENGTGTIVAGNPNAY